MSAARSATVALALASLLLAPAVRGHDFRIGDLVIDHPYALPAPAGSRDGAAFLRGLRNAGQRADRLLGASTPVADAVELLHAEVGSDGRLQLRTVDAVELAPGAALRLRHDGPWRLRLRGLKTPLLNGDAFALTLRFEHAGEKAVVVTVQQPREPAREHAH